MPDIKLPQPLLRLFSWLALHTCFGFEVQGLERLRQASQGVLLAGNHTGLLDSLAILAACRRPFRFVMAEEVFGWGLIGILVRFSNIIALVKGRERQALGRIIRTLKTGGCVCIFPEGKLTQDGVLQGFQEGVAFLQEKSGVPILPFAIVGGYEAWPQHGQPRRHKIILRFGEPIPPSQGLSRPEVICLLEARVAALLDEPATEALSASGSRSPAGSPLPSRNPG